MQFETGRSPAIYESPRQRWSIALSYGFIIIGLLIGLYLRDSSLNRSSAFSNVEAGISARYPARWLLEQPQGSIFRVRDMAQRGYKTEIEVSALPVGPASAERNLLDRLSMRRAQTLIDYTILGYDSYRLPDESEALTMSYAFVSRDASPFLEGGAAIVQGLDLLALRRGQALVISFRADAALFESELATLEQFIESLQF